MDNILTAIKTVGEVKKELENLVEYGADNMPYWFSKGPFATDKEAVEYAILHDKTYKKIKHLPDDALVIECYSEHFKKVEYSPYNKENNIIQATSGFGKSFSIHLVSKNKGDKNG
ncbi:hypothetical protein [Nitrosophilus labii]|uniref:hypothetical protein n=1 Tax=Nitrosophilus labii TaxID=2706014 RepID=UPI001656B57F|nr:hypothetical protein [Nitrosophilus labii]